jgi:hypothetical protein
MTFLRIACLAGLGTLVLSSVALTEDKAAEPASGAEAETASQTEEPLTPEEKAEKQARKACKVEICGILESKNPAGADIACDIVKTWREKDIAKMLGGKVDWPFGNAVCQSRLALRRADLARAMSEPSYEVALGTQKVRCTLAQKGGSTPYAVEVSIAPKVSFEKGKAVKARLNWGEASGPMLVYALIYAGTGLDNSSNVAGPHVVRMVNEFTSKKCAEVRKELGAQGK